MTQQPSPIARLKTYQERFLATNRYQLTWEQEALFARQQLENNSYLMGVATKDTDGLRNSVLNVAAIGVSLNPALQHAYLVPRNNKVLLSLSYRGLVALATESGSIDFAKAEVVHKGDTFVWNGPFDLPTHNADVLAEDRIGDELESVAGAYCAARLTDGTWMVEVLTLKEIMAIRNKADSLKGKNRSASPWVQFPLEMVKKAAVRRASKMWPQKGDRKRLDEAIHIDQQSDQINLDDLDAENVFISAEQAKEITERMAAIGRDIGPLLRYLGVEDANEIQTGQLEEAIGIVTKQEAKAAAQQAPAEAPEEEAEAEEATDASAA